MYAQCNCFSICIFFISGCVMCLIYLMLFTGPRKARAPMCMYLFIRSYLCNVIINNSNGYSNKNNIYILYRYIYICMLWAKYRLIPAKRCCCLSTQVLLHKFTHVRIPAVRMVAASGFAWNPALSCDLVVLFAVFISLMWCIVFFA